MKKIAKFIEKHDNIAMLILLIIITSALSYYRNLNANDELWNFSNIYKMYNGYAIYKDINVIITPLYFWTGKIIFSIFGANYVVFRTYQAVIPYTLLFFIIYKIFKKIGIKKYNSAIYTSVIGIIYIRNLKEANYNILAIAFVMLGIYSLISNKTYKKQSILQALIVVLTFLTKQNIGIYYLIGLIIYELIFEKQNKITKIKTILLECGIIVALLLTFYGFMKKNGIWKYFINYAFGGIGEFATKNLSSIILSTITIAIIIATVIILIIIKKYKLPLTEEQKRSTQILGIFAIIMQSIAYTIFNTAHILMASVNYIIFMIFIINEVATRCIQKKHTIKLEKIKKRNTTFYNNTKFSNKYICKYLLFKRNSK